MKYNNKLNKLLLLWTGLFSTFQITQMCGVTLFTILMFVFVAYYLLSNKARLSINKKKFVIYYIVIMTISELMIITIPLNNSGRWQFASIKKYIILIVMMVFFYILNEEKYQKLNIFIRGVHYSCLIQLVWCYVQLFSSKILNIDVNKLLFGSSQVNLLGQNMITGLNVNAGILSPALILLFLYDDRIFVKVTTMAVFFLAGSSTMVICGILMVLFSLGYKYLGKKIVIERRKISSLLCAFLVVILVMLLMSYFSKSLIDRAFDIFIHLISRLNSARSGTFTDGSTFTHTRYYTSIITVLDKTKLLNILFGYGVGCSGVPFVQIFNQYSDIVYVPESDIITYLYDIGVVGFLFVYIFYTTIIIRGKKIDWRYSAFVSTVLIGGIFYGMQLNWVLLFEWLCMSNIIDRKNIFNIRLSRKR